MQSNEKITGIGVNLFLRTIVLVVKMMASTYQVTFFVNLADKDTKGKAELEMVKKSSKIFKKRIQRLLDK